MSLVSISPDTPTMVPVQKCKGLLKDPITEYNNWAFWHGKGYTDGWFAHPIKGLAYVECQDQTGSKFVVKD